MKSKLEKRGRPSRKDRPRHEADVLERSIKVVNLKRNYDLTFKEIGDQLGISDAQAYRDFKSIIRKTLDEHREEIDEMRQMQNEQIAILWRKWLPLALGQSGDPNLRAAQFCERLLKRKADLNGMDRPIKIAPTTPDGENEFTGISEARRTVEEEISRLLAGVNNNANGKKLAKASNGTASKK